MPITGATTAPRLLSHAADPLPTIRHALPTAEKSRTPPNASHCQKKLLQPPPLRCPCRSRAVPAAAPSPPTVESSQATATAYPPLFPSSSTKSRLLYHGRSHLPSICHHCNQPWLPPLCIITAAGQCSQDPSYCLLFSTSSCPLSHQRHRPPPCPLPLLMAGIHAHHSHPHPPFPSLPSSPHRPSSPLLPWLQPTILLPSSQSTIIKFLTGFLAAHCRVHLPRSVEPPTLHHCSYNQLPIEPSPLFSFFPIILSLV